MRIKITGEDNNDLSPTIVTLLLNPSARGQSEKRTHCIDIVETRFMVG